MRAQEVVQSLRAQADPRRAPLLMRYFKTGPGEYGAGDRFLGLTVPQVRQVARTCVELPTPEVERLLHSPYNEVRLLALVLMGRRYARGSDRQRDAIYRMYLRNFKYVNNWNLVDTSASYIVGCHLLSRSRAPLYRWIRSSHLWTRRIAVIATQAFIREGQFEDTFRLTESCLKDPEDLMHKACGWMLREVGKKDRRQLERFLNQHAKKMPRTLLRYAIERLPETQRKRYMKR